MWKPSINRRCSNLPAALIAAWLLAGCAATPDNPVVALPQAQPQAPPAEVEETYQQALEQMQAGQWPAARASLENITAAQPALAGPWLNLGIVCTRLGEAQAAEYAFRQSIEANPANPVAYNQLGIFYRRTGRLEEARDSYAAALGVAPEDPDSHWNLGILHDVYLPDARLALHHYERYRQLTGSDDPQLAAWITALQARLPADNLTAEVKP